MGGSWSPMAQGSSMETGYTSHRIEPSSSQQISWWEATVCSTLTGRACCGLTAFIPLYDVSQHMEIIIKLKR